MSRTRITTHPDAEQEISNAILGNEHTCADDCARDCKEHKRQDHEKDRSRSTLRNRVEYHRSNGRVVWGARLYVDQFRWHVQVVGLSRRVACAMLYVDQFQWHVQVVGLLLTRWSTRALFYERHGPQSFTNLGGCISGALSRVDDDIASLSDDDVRV
jgi:hypothetical protein